MFMNLLQKYQHSLQMAAQPNILLTSTFLLISNENRLLYWMVKPDIIKLFQSNDTKSNFASSIFCAVGKTISSNTRKVTARRLDPGPIVHDQVYVMHVFNLSVIYRTQPKSYSTEVWIEGHSQP